MEFSSLLVALVLGSIGSVGLAGLMLLLKDKHLEKTATVLTYLAGGTLLGATMLGMIPKSASMLNPSLALKVVLAGIVFFFILEKIILWHSCRDKNCERHLKASIPIIIFGDAFHNAIDGIVIASSFLISTEMGFFTTLSVILHEIPQELGDFGILIKGGLSRSKALWYNMLSGSTAIVFGIIAFFTLNSIKSVVPYFLAFSAASFLYIALAELIPEMHRKTSLIDSLLQLLLTLTGIGIIYLIIILK